MGIVAWLVLGLIAGFLASAVMEGGGYGVVGDIVVGILGAVIGGFLFSTLLGRPGPVDNLDIGAIVVACVGACLLIAILRAVSGRRVAP
jgi:uncharacterized membrane protein YeaQ/YmgE (transglycosylase-associated protein family)